MKFGLAVFCSLYFLVLGCAQDNSPPKTPASFSIGLEVGQKAPAFQAKATDGKTINFPADYKGKVVLLPGR